MEMKVSMFTQFTGSSTYVDISSSLVLPSYLSCKQLPLSYGKLADIAAFSAQSRTMRSGRTQSKDTQRLLCTYFIDSSRQLETSLP